MKRMTSLVLVLALLFSLFTASAAIAETKTLRFTFVLPQAANEIWGVAKEGFEDACKALGVDASVVAPMKPNDINEMNSLVETALPRVWTA